MDKPIDIEVVRTEALRKLGRNIVNFSKIEGTLKYLLSVSWSPFPRNSKYRCVAVDKRIVLPSSSKALK